MKANKNPMDIIRYIMDSVTIFFGHKIQPITCAEKVFDRKKGTTGLFLEDSYDFSGKAVLSDMNFMRNLKEYEKD